jgi:hypothetical protein
MEVRLSTRWPVSFGAAMTALRVRELAAARVGGEGGEPVAVDVSERPLRAGWSRSLRTMSRIPAGRADMSRIPVMPAAT